MEKFSFIYTLTLSSSSNFFQQNRDRVDNLDSQSAFDMQPKLAAKSVSKDRKRSSVDLSKNTNEVSSESLAVNSALTAPGNTASTITAQWYQVESSVNSYDLDLSAIAPSLGTAAIEENTRSRRNYIGKILLVSSFGYLMLVVWWLFGHHSEYLLGMIKGKHQVVLSESDAKFIDYMERSLSTIDTQASQQDLEAEAETKSQVVYVPVFTPQTQTAPPLATLPQISINNEGATAVPQPPEPPSEVVKIPSPPPLPAPTPIIESPQPNLEASNSETATTSDKPTIEHTLIGILELGNKSAALFKIEGATKKIWQGEEIDNSGWILDSIADQKAQISHHGKVRSLDVGEKF